MNLIFRVIVKNALSYFDILINYHILTLCSIAKFCLELGINSQFVIATLWYYYVFGDNKMQLDYQLQQHVFSLPMELKAEVLDFVLRLEQKQERQAKEQLKALMSKVPASINLADELIADRRLEVEKELKDIAK